MVRARHQDQARQLIAWGTPPSEGTRPRCVASTHRLARGTELRTTPQLLGVAKRVRGNNGPRSRWQADPVIRDRYAEELPAMRGPRAPRAERSQLPCRRARWRSGDDTRRAVPVGQYVVAKRLGHGPGARAGRARQRALAFLGPHGYELITVYDKASNWFGGMEKGVVLFSARVGPTGLVPRTARLRAHHGHDRRRTGSVAWRRVSCCSRGPPATSRTVPGAASWKRTQPGRSALSSHPYRHPYTEIRGDARLTATERGGAERPCVRRYHYKYKIN